MNRLLTIAILSAAWPLSSFAAQPTADSIVLDCAHPALPVLQAIADLIDSNNAGAAYQARANLMADSRRACLRGAEQVQLVSALPQASTSEWPRREVAKAGPVH